MTSVYSETPLIKRLGIKLKMKIQLINPPDEYYDLVEMNLQPQLSKQNESPDLIHLFEKSTKEFEKEMKNIEKKIRKNSSMIIWVSWYKKSAKITTDITEDVILNYALKNGLVDMKVCAVSDIWSGLKLVVPLKKR